MNPMINGIKKEWSAMPEYFKNYFKGSQNKSGFYVFSGAMVGVFAFLVISLVLV